MTRDTVSVASIHGGVALDRRLSAAIAAEIELAYGTGEITLRLGPLTPAARNKILATINILRGLRADGSKPGETR